jgi:hypothetical protein
VANITGVLIAIYQFNINSKHHCNGNINSPFFINN